MILLHYYDIYDIGLLSTYIIVIMIQDTCQPWSPWSSRAFTSSSRGWTSESYLFMMARDKNPLYPWLYIYMYIHLQIYHTSDFMKKSNFKSFESCHSSVLLRSLIWRAPATGAPPHRDVFHDGEVSQDPWDRCWVRLVVSYKSYCGWLQNPAPVFGM